MKTVSIPSFIVGLGRSIVFSFPYSNKVKDLISQKKLNSWVEDYASLIRIS